MSQPPAYWDYLALDRLLDLQHGLADGPLEPDELHFMIVHQVFELWFKLMLSELRLARDHLGGDRVDDAGLPHVVHHLRRVNEILRVAVSHFHLVETLTPQDFLAFRDKLSPASGFQSFQMRELEIVLGLGADQRVRYGTVDPLDHIRKLAGGSPAARLAVSRLEAAQGEVTLKDALERWLFRTPIRGSSPADAQDDAVVEAFMADYLDAWLAHNRSQFEHMRALGVADDASLGEREALAEQAARTFLGASDVAGDPRRRRIRAGLLFIESYRSLPLLAWPRVLIDTLVECDEYLVLWRSRHVRMVERTIGRRLGTGGSSGVEYLERTTAYRVFGDLWTVRTLLLRRDLVPSLGDAGPYGFAR